VPTALLLIALSAPSPADLSAAWHRLRSEAQHCLAPSVTPTASQWKRLAAGEVVKWRLSRTAGADQLIAMGFIDQPIEAVWVGILDDRHSTLVSDVIERQLPGSTASRKVLYQHLHLPVPFSDRHWTLIVQSNPQLFAERHGRAWERTWDLDPRGEASLADLPAALRSEVDGSIWTPENAGGWLLLSVGWGTLVMYHLRTNIGGYIPEGLVTRYAMSKMDELIAQVGRFADRAPRHYVKGHAFFLRPDGSRVPYF